MEPQTVIEVYDLINQAAGASYGDYKRDEHIEKMFVEAKAKYPFMRRKDNYLCPTSKPKKFWDAVDAFGTPHHLPMGLTWRRFMKSDRFSPIPLGKLWGEFEFWLLPAPDLLHPSHDRYMPDLPRPSSDILGVSYPDGHPSEEEVGLSVPAGSDRETLRAFTSLGWIARLSGPHYIKTGHVLVVDMEPGRNRQPWIILASERPENPGAVNVDGDGYEHAEEKVERNDSSVKGVLPGDRNRTPVGKIRAIDTSFRGSILHAFGQDFAFKVARTGSSRGYIRSKEGPDLAQIMDWFLDTDTGDFVCFAADGPEYMRRKKGTGEVVHSRGAFRPACGQQGIHGTIVDEVLEEKPGVAGPAVAGTTSLESSLGSLRFEKGMEKRQRQDMKDTAGF